MAAKKEVKEKAPAKESVQESSPAPKTATGPKWVKVTAQELAKIQAEGKLMGYNPNTGEALVK